MPNIAVFGCGRIGKMHAENIHSHPRAKLAGVFDVFSKASHEVALSLGVREFASADEVFAAKDVDAVLIATSTPTYADFIVQAVAARKPALCEKSNDQSIDRIRARADKLAGTDIPVMLGFVRRFDKGHAGVRRVIEAGQLGDVHQVVITSHDPDIAPDVYIEVSGGIFRDRTIHDFDDMKVFAEESFGPIAAITRFATEKEALARANASDMGLSAYAFTTSPDRARRTVAALKAGMVGINSFALAASEAPFGGTNHSGMGREGGTEGIEDYLDTKLAQIVF